MVGRIERRAMKLEIQDRKEREEVGKIVMRGALSVKFVENLILAMLHYIPMSKISIKLIQNKSRKNLFYHSLKINFHNSKIFHSLGFHQNRINNQIVSELVKTH